MKKVKMVHGKVEKKEVEIKDLSDILGVAKSNKFKNFKTREEYESSLFKMSQRELMDETLRVGKTPSAIREICRNKCLAAWDDRNKTHKYTAPEGGKDSLEDIIKGKK
jgi:hypothetical protein